eukprot:361401-Chlamydomonas_euryale.AAC.4
MRRVAVATRAVSDADVVARTGNHSCHNGAYLTAARKAELEAVCEHIAQVRARFGAHGKAWLGRDVCASLNTVLCGVVPRRAMRPGWSCWRLVFGIDE